MNYYGNAGVGVGVAPCGCVALCVGRIVATAAVRGHTSAPLARKTRTASPSRRRRPGPPRPPAGSCFVRVGEEDSEEGLALAAASSPLRAPPRDGLRVARLHSEEQNAIAPNAPTNRTDQSLIHDCGTGSEPRGTRADSPGVVSVCRACGRQGACRGSVRVAHIRVTQIRVTYRGSVSRHSREQRQAIAPGSWCHGATDQLVSP